MPNWGCKGVNRKRLTKNKQLPLTLNHLTRLESTATAIVIVCLQTVLHGPWEWIYEVWTACLESNETQHRLCLCEKPLNSAASKDTAVSQKVSGHRGNIRRDSQQSCNLDCPHVTPTTSVLMSFKVVLTGSLEDHRQKNFETCQ